MAMKTNVYQVKAMIEDKEHESGWRCIWQFNSIEAYSSDGAIHKCKKIMLNTLGNTVTMNRKDNSIRKFKWTAKLEWEDNLAVN